MFLFDLLNWSEPHQPGKLRHDGYFLVIGERAVGGRLGYMQVKCKHLYGQGYAGRCAGGLKSTACSGDSHYNFSAARPLFGAVKPLQPGDKEPEVRCNDNQLRYKPSIAAPVTRARFIRAMPLGPHCLFITTHFLLRRHLPLFLLLYPVRSPIRPAKAPYHLPQETRSAFPQRSCYCLASDSLPTPSAARTCQAKPAAPTPTQPPSNPSI